MKAVKTSPAQRVMLFALWRTVCRDHGWSRAESEVERGEFTREALGIGDGDDVPSWGALSNRQVDRLKQALESAAGRLAVQNTEAGAEGASDAAERARLIWAIERDTAAAYGSAESGERAVATICGRVHGRSSAAARGFWRGLPLEDLRRLAMTCGRAERRKNSNNGGFWGD